MERLKCNLTFRELGKDENLYDDVDLTAGSMVDAQYRRVAGYEDNPDVCALPKMPSIRDILALNGESSRIRQRTGRKNEHC